MKKDDSWEALIFWWERQIGPPLCGLVRRLGPRAVAVRVCVWGNCPVRGGVLYVSSINGSPSEIFREGIIV